MPMMTPPPDPESQAPDPSQGGPAGGPSDSAPGGPPIGNSPATQPVANRGMQAAALAKLAVAVHLLESLLPEIGAGSEAGQAVLKALNSLSKHIPDGSISPGVEQSSMQNLILKARQQAPQIAAMRAGQPAGAGGPPPPGAGGGAMPPPGLAAMMAPQGNA